MGKQGQPRTLIALRISAGGLVRIDDLADQAGVTRSEMARRLLSAAVSDPTIRRKVTKG
jgi:hypothetical protein